MNAPLKLPELVRTLSADFAQRAAAHDRDASFPFENFSDLHQAGLLTLAAPISLGGQGATLAQLSDVIGAIGKGDPATALVLIMQFTQHRSLGRAGNRWPEALAQKVVREAAEKGALINALRVEPELGSPARGGLPATIARQTSQGWRVSGRKLYSTGAPILSWYALWVRTDEAEPRVGYLLVPAGLAGTRIEETWDHLGLRASGSHDVVFEDVLVPFENAVDLRLPAEWLGADPQAQAEISVLISALYTGVAEAARDWLLGFLHARKPSSLGASL
ncbi:MAG: acyl-CoA dehydrogenase family protein, partial [Comamonas testosteroni]|uniref:acyl-CoA dehydrogenase family protein n=1 Tax=Comamonas testosteroni TaxID=285 RepID=UPI003D0B7897